MDLRLFHQFRDIAYRRAGIHLRDGKETLVAARVAKRLRALGLGSDREYLEFLESDTSGEELIQFLDVISTNYTSFFREREHFDFLSSRIREWVAQGQRRFRIWCAASSTGEEPYSLVITMLEATEEHPVDFKILATDISTRALAQAQDGVYEMPRLEPLTRAQLQAYFQPAGNVRRGPPAYRVRPELKEPLRFKRLNLAEPPYPMSGPLDFVFCRNVMMYFDRPVRQGLVAEAERLLRPDGFMVTGHAETLQGLETRLAAITPSVYTFRGQNAAARKSSHVLAR